MLTALLILLLAIILLLSMPFGVESRRRDEKHELRLILAGIRVLVKKRGAKRLRKRPKKLSQDPLAQVSALQGSALEIWEYFDGELPHRLWLTLKRFGSCLHFKVHEFRLCIALESPAATGLAYGAACAAAVMLPRSMPVELDCDFNSAKSVLDYRIALTIIPAQLGFEALRSLVTLRAWAVFRMIRAAKLNNKSAREAS